MANNITPATSEQSYVCSVVLTDEQMTVTSPGGSKSLTLLTEQVNGIKMTNEESALYYWVQGQEQAEGKPYKVELSLNDMRILVAIRNKTQAVDNSKVEETRAAASKITQQDAARQPVQGNGKEQPVTLKRASPSKNGKGRVKQSAEEIHGRVAGRTCLQGGVDETEQRVKTLEKIAQTCEKQFIMFSYDIPSNLDNDCPNPSARLWWHGFRDQKSVWCMPESELDSRDMTELMAHWDGYRDQGVKYRIVKFAADQQQVIKEMARDRLCEELIRVHEALVKNIISADEKLEEIKAELDTQKEVDAAEIIRDNKVRAILAKAIESYQSAVHCAEMFEETGAVDDLLKGLRKAIQAQREALNARTLPRGGKPAPVLS